MRPLAPLAPLIFLLHLKEMFSLEISAELLSFEIPPRIFFAGIHPRVDSEKPMRTSVILGAPSRCQK